MANSVRSIEFDRLVVGAPVRVVFEKITDEISLPRVRPAD
jgi:hypothetical protein